MDRTTHFLTTRMYFPHRWTTVTMRPPSSLARRFMGTFGAACRRALALLVFVCGTAAISVTVRAAPTPVDTVTLLLHGTNSSPTTWNDLVKSPYFANVCPIVRLGVAVTQVSRCYRYQFADRRVENAVWTRGDGATFLQLGAEVRAALNQIAQTVSATKVILAAHSRGGLAARAYLQRAPAPSKLALLTIGTPHQGTPFGRIGVWMRDNDYGPDDTIDDLRFVFSPSVRYMATDHNSQGQPIRSSVSAEIWNLNAGVGTLTGRVSSFGVIYSKGLYLGQKGFGDLNLLDGVGAQGAALLLPGSFDKMLGFTLRNIAEVRKRPVLPDTWSCEGDRKTRYPWACDGDGIVPTISQRLNLLPGFKRGTRPFRVTPLARVPHTAETGRVTEIVNMLSLLQKDLR
jgi:pimeloyl-ACP methyl ester carboxylesterase